MGLDTFCRLLPCARPLRGAFRRKNIADWQSYNQKLAAEWLVENGTLTGRLCE